MPKIIQERKKCIGCGTCTAVCPDHWSMGEDQKANLKGAKLVDQENEIFELETNDIGCSKEAVSACPVQIIKIEE